MHHAIFVWQITQSIIIEIEYSFGFSMKSQFNSTIIKLKYN